jgi:hypothetical protein
LILGLLNLKQSHVLSHALWVMEHLICEFSFLFSSCTSAILNCSKCKCKQQGFSLTNTTYIICDHI